MDFISVILIIWIGVMIFNRNDDDDDHYDGGCGSPQITVIDRRHRNHNRRNR